MEKVISLLFAISTALYSPGQYAFSTTSVPYQALAAPLPLNNGASWNNSSSFVVPFNSDFSIQGQAYAAINVMAGGGLSFPGPGGKQLRVFGHPDSGYLLEDRDQVNSASPITYEITGNTGQQILKVQWANAGFREWCDSSDPNDYVNFQIWLFEEDDRLEVHFGDYTADAGAYGQPDCNSGTDGTQFIFQFDDCSNALSLTGPSALPSYDFRNHCGWQPGVHVSGTPPSGTVYNLAPNDVGMDEASARGLHVHPNPVSGILHVACPTVSAIQGIEIIDLRGRTCFADLATTWTDNMFLVDVGGLDNGIYSLKLTVEGASPIIRRIVKAE